jgi:hypothetical protein
MVLRDQPQGYVFVVVTRLPNPSGEGTVTIIYSDYTRALGQVARTLTDDQRLSETGWPSGKPAPASFQALFVVHLKHGKATKPGLLAWRMDE